jgi:hypothetical protein
MDDRSRKERKKGDLIGDRIWSPMRSGSRSGRGDLLRHLRKMSTRSPLCTIFVRLLFSTKLPLSSCNSMCAAQFRSISPPPRGRTPPSPPHPLQASLPGIAPDLFGPNAHTMRVERDPPTAPPSSPSPSHLANSEIRNYRGQDSLSGVIPNEMSRWDQLLYYFSDGRSGGRRAYDYMPFTAIAPRYLASNTRTPAWILEEVRGGISSDLIKLRPGSAICLQDTTLQEAFNAPSAPTMLGVIDRMQWGEDGYQIATVNTHVHSPSGYDFEAEVLSFIAIPTRFIHPAHRFSRVTCNTIGQMSINNVVYPPCRVWEPTSHGLRIFNLAEMVTMDRFQVVSTLIDEQAQFGWI